MPYCHWFKRTHTHSHLPLLGTARKGGLLALEMEFSAAVSGHTLFAYRQPRHRRQAIRNGCTLHSNFPVLFLRFCLEECLTCWKRCLNRNALFRGFRVSINTFLSGCLLIVSLHKLGTFDGVLLKFLRGKIDPFPFWIRLHIRTCTHTLSPHSITSHRWVPISLPVLLVMSLSRLLIKIRPQLSARCCNVAMWSASIYPCVLHVRD